MNFTDIFSAVKEGTVEDVRNFVEQNGAAVIHAKDDDGRTPLHNAAQHNPNVEVLKYLVSQGADVKTKDNMDWTPLHQATLSNPNVEVLKYLVSQGVDINAKNKEAVSDLTPLHIAIFTGNIEFTKFLISAAADVNSKSKVVGTLLFTAAMEKHIELAEILVHAGADVNAVEDDKTGHTLLHKVILLDLVEAAKFLVSEKASVKAKDNEGNTPLHTAVLMDKIELVKFLVDSANADTEAKDNNGDTPLTKYVFCKVKDIEIIKFLVSKNANIKAENNKGETALSRALFLGDAAVIECLTAKIDVEVYKKRGLEFLSKGLFEQAIAEYTQLIQIRPNNAEAHKSRGIAYVQKAETHRLNGVDCSQIKEYGQAINDFNSVLKLASGDATTYSFRGSAYAQKSEYSKAIADFSEALRLRPNNHFDHLSRGIAYKESRQYDLAKRDLEKVLDLNPDNTTISIAKNMLNELHREEQEERKRREAENRERKRIEDEKRKKRNKIAKVAVILAILGVFLWMANNSGKKYYYIGDAVGNAGDIVNNNTFVDSRDRKMYKSVKIGSQTWMA
jgi:ankyrin repeat protein/regulator of sirC expression with transglutaminase-like and TPR domain